MWLEFLGRLYYGDNWHVIVVFRELYFVNWSKFLLEGHCLHKSGRLKIKIALIFRSATVQLSLKADDREKYFQ